MRNITSDTRKGLKAIYFIHSYEELFGTDKEENKPLVETPPAASVAEITQQSLSNLGKESK